MDFDLFSHQIVAHDKPSGRAMVHHNAVDGHDVPVPHFGVILTPERWAARLQAAGVRFVIEPHTRFAGEAGEQSTMFFLAPSGNALEFKAFADFDSIFAS